MDWQQIFSSGAVTLGLIGIAVVAALIVFAARPRWRTDPKQRAVVIGVVALPVIAVLIGRAIALGQPDQVLARALAAAVRDSAANYPQRLNDEQEVVRVVSKGTTITFVNRFVRLTVADIDANAILAYREPLRRQVCSTSEFVRRGATQVFAYYDRNDVFITQIAFTSRDCSQ